MPTMPASSMMSVHPASASVVLASRVLVISAWTAHERDTKDRQVTGKAAVGVGKDVWISSTFTACSKKEDGK